jgi:hypothetical protein
MSNIFIKDVHNEVWGFDTSDILNISCKESDCNSDKEITFTQKDKEDITLICTSSAWMRLCNKLECV